MELAENNQYLLNKGHFSRDAAEALALDHAYRREVQVVLEAQSNVSRRTAEEVQDHWAVLRIAQETHAKGMPPMGGAAQGICEAHAAAAYRSHARERRGTEAE